MKKGNEKKKLINAIFILCLFSFLKNLINRKKIISTGSIEPKILILIDSAINIEAKIEL